MDIFFNAEGFERVRRMHFEIEPQDGGGCCIILKDGAARLFIWHYHHLESGSVGIQLEYNRIKRFFRMDAEQK